MMNTRAHTGYRGDYHHVGSHQGGIFSFHLGSRQIQACEKFQEVSGGVLQEVVLG